MSQVKKVRLFFPKELTYGKRKYEGGKVHDIEEERPGFIDRWIKRGCILEDEHKAKKLNVKPQEPTKPNNDNLSNEPSNSNEGEKPSNENNDELSNESSNKKNDDSKKNNNSNGFKDNKNNSQFKRN